MKKSHDDLCRLSTWESSLLHIAAICGYTSIYSVTLSGDILSCQQTNQNQSFTQLHSVPYAHQFSSNSYKIYLGVV